MFTKPVLYVAIFILAFAGVWFALSFFTDSNEKVPQEEIPVVFPEVNDIDEFYSSPPAPSTNLQSGSMLVTTNDGDTEEILLDNGAVNEKVLAEGLSLLFENSQYSDYYDIAYRTGDNSIAIYLHDLPLSFARDVAIQELLSGTNLTQSRLCDLYIVVETNRYVSPEYAGLELGVPGCPGVVDLP